MAYEETQRRDAGIRHGVTVEGRSRVTVSGVSDVESFDENEVVMSTSQGLMSVQGAELRIDKLSIDTGDVTLNGVIDRVVYEDEAESSGGFFSRLFR